MAVANLKSFVGARLRRLRAVLKEEKLAALIVVDPANVRYLSGFSGDDSVLIVSARRKAIVSDTRFTEQIRQECPGLPIKLRRGPMAPAVAEVLDRWGLLKKRRKNGRKRAVHTVGIEADVVTVTQYRTYRKAVGSGLKETAGLLGRLRLTKDDYEVRQLVKAVRIAESAFTTLTGVIKPGMTELAMAARMEFEMMQGGASGPSFPTIAAVGAHGAQPHAVPARAKLGAKQPVLFDWGACYRGYRSDLTRCLHTGRIRPVFAEAYQAVLDAQCAAIEAVKPGATLAEVDAAARRHWPKKLPMYGHGTGHGIGLNVHEGPALSGRVNGQLREGMVVTVEPGCYVPGRFGIRIEDDVLVTARGRRVLSRLAKDLDSVTI